MKPDYSLIVPIYNETARLYTGLSEILHALSRDTHSYELILVDDGSVPDVAFTLSQHRAISKRLAPLFNRKQVKIVRLPFNQGKGKAIASGVECAHGRDILFTDVDCSVPLDILPLFRNALKTHDVAIASRRLASSRIMVHQSWRRESAGRVYTFLSNVICGAGVSDVTCGLKAFRRDAAKRLFRARTIDRWAFDTEILFLARRMGYTIEEIPVSWFNKVGSRVKFGDTMRAFVDLVSIRLRKKYV